MICRYAIFEQVYLQDQAMLPPSLKENLTTTLKALYTAVLNYLAEVISCSNRSFAGRSMRVSSQSQAYKFGLQLDQCVVSPSPKNWGSVTDTYKIVKRKS